MRHNNNAPAYPTGHNQSGTGLSKREYFAGMAMQGFLSNKWFVEGSSWQNNENYLAVFAVQCADALLKELEKTNNNGE